MSEMHEEAPADLENAPAKTAPPATGHDEAFGHMLGALGSVLAVIEGIAAVVPAIRSTGVHFAAARQSLENAKKALE